MTQLHILPPAQRAFWDEELALIPAGWVLYGGTAVALHLGHRQSRDFDFFSSDALDRVGDPVLIKAPLGSPPASTCSARSWRRSRSGSSHATMSTWPHYWQRG